MMIGKDDSVLSIYKARIRADIRIVLNPFQTAAAKNGVLNIDKRRSKGMKADRKQVAILVRKKIAKHQDDLCAIYAELNNEVQEAVERLGEEDFKENPTEKCMEVLNNFAVLDETMKYFEILLVHEHMEQNGYDGDENGNWVKASE